MGITGSPKVSYHTKSPLLLATTSKNLVPTRKYCRMPATSSGIWSKQEMKATLKFIFQTLALMHSENCWGNNSVMLLSGTLILICKFIQLKEMWLLFSQTNFTKISPSSTLPTEVSGHAYSKLTIFIRTWQLVLWHFPIPRWQTVTNVACRLLYLVVHTQRPFYSFPLRIMWPKMQIPVCNICDN